MNTGILIITFNRPDKFKVVLDGLKKCKEFFDLPLFISIDGPRTHNILDVHQQKIIIELIDELRNERGNVQIQLNERNLGLAKNIVNSINWAFESCDSLIILEDDIEVISSSFLSYNITALKKFRNSEVYQISSYIYPVSSDFLNTLSCDIFKMQILACWGWATWKNKWSVYVSEISTHYNYWSQSTTLINKFNIEGDAHFYEQLSNNYNNKIDTWAVRWYSSWLMLNGYSIFPKHSLVRNIGFDGSGTFTNKSEKYETHYKLNFTVGDWKLDERESSKLKKMINSFFQYKFSSNKNLFNIRNILNLPKRMKSYIKRLLLRTVINGISKPSIFSSTIEQKVKIAKGVSLYNCKIGAYSYISHNTSMNMVIMGKFCSIGPNCHIGWGIHPIDGLSTSPMFYSTRKQNGFSMCTEDKVVERKLIKIGNDVFIGMNVTILDGVTIGDGAVIGAGAVVSKDIPSYAVAIGNPIKILKYRFNEETIERLLKIRWWDYSDDELYKVERYFNNVDKFFQEMDVS